MKTSLLTVLLIGVLSLPACVFADEQPVLWGFALDGHPITEGRLEELASSTGLKSDLIVFFLQWPAVGNTSSSGFPLESLDSIRKSGAVPCVTWEPMYYKDGKEIAIPHEQLLRGDYDGFILDFARQARSWNKPLLIRFAHEMNIKRYHWGTAKEEYGPESPGIYKRMFRHVVDLFRQAGAHNVLWVFCPNAESVPNASRDPSFSWNVLSNYYPGDEYIDILGIDGYNWGTTQTMKKEGWDSSWKGFEEIFEPAYRQLKALDAGASRKPIIIFETATVSKGGDKIQWIREALKVSRSWKIQGIVWFQSNKELDWRINRGGGTDYISFISQATSPSGDWAGDLINRKVR